MFLVALFSLVCLTASLPMDLMCFVKFYGNVTEKATRVTHAKVYVGQYEEIHFRQYGSVETVLTRGVPSYITLKYSPRSRNQVPDQNPRNLTLLFDGEKVYGSMALLVDLKNSSGQETQSWAGCGTEWGDPEKRIRLTYYDHHIDTTYDGVRADYREYVAVEIRPYDTPFAPSYDNACAYFRKADLAGRVPRVSFSPVVVNVTHINQKVSGSYSFTFRDTMLWQDFVTVRPGQVTFLQFNQTSARAMADFTGQNVVTRNLTLWLNETGHLNAAMAYLRQKNNNGYGNIIQYEEWKCPNANYYDNYMQLKFSEYSEFTALINYGRYDRDMIIISGCFTNGLVNITTLFISLIWVLSY